VCDETKKKMVGQQGKYAKGLGSQISLAVYDETKKMMAARKNCL